MENLMKKRMTATLVVMVHLLVVLGHGVAHEQLHIQPNIWQRTFIALVIFIGRSRDGAAVDAAPKNGLGCVVANNGWFTVFRSGLPLLCSRFRQCSGAPSRSLGVPVQNQRHVACRD